MISATQTDSVTPAHRDQLWIFLGIGLIVLWLMFWEVSVRAGLRRDFFTPPSELAVFLYRSLFVTGELGNHLWATFTRLIGGFVVGALPALWLGFLLGQNSRARLLWSPLLAALGLIPMLSALPWFIIMFGVQDLGKWVIVSAAVFYPVLFCTMKGVQIANALQHQNTGSLSSAQRNEWNSSAGPWVFTGLKLATVVGIATLSGAEMFASTRGLEFEVVVAGTKFEMARVYSAMFSAAFLIYALWLGLTLLEFAFERGLGSASSAPSVT